MIVAIVAAVRVNWKDEGNSHDRLYFWRLAMSNIWYSSEVAGTIIVQCIPILRPFIREIHTSLTSKKLGSTTGDTYSVTPRSKFSAARMSADPFGDPRDNNYSANCWAERSVLEDDKVGKAPRIELSDIPESGLDHFDETPLKKDMH